MLKSLGVKIFNDIKDLDILSKCKNKYDFSKKFKKFSHHVLLNFKSLLVVGGDSSLVGGRSKWVEPSVLFVLLVS